MRRVSVWLEVAAWLDLRGHRGSRFFLRVEIFLMHAREPRPFPGRCGSSGPPKKGRISLRALSLARWVGFVRGFTLGLSGVYFVCCI